MKTRRLSLMTLVLIAATAGEPAVGQNDPGDPEARLSRVMEYTEQAKRLAGQGEAYPSAMHAEKAWLMLESHPEFRAAAVVRSAVSWLREASAYGQAGDAELARESAAHALDSLRRFAEQRRGGDS